MLILWRVWGYDHGMVFWVFLLLGLWYVADVGYLDGDNRCLSEPATSSVHGDTGVLDEAVDVAHSWLGDSGLWHKPRALAFDVSSLTKSWRLE